MYKTRYQGLEHSVASRVTKYKLLPTLLTPKGYKAWLALYQELSPSPPVWTHTSEHT
jgi:hypothetical protein